MSPTTPRFPEDQVDTIFIVKGNEQAEAPFGQTVIYEKDAAAASFS